MFQSQQSDAHRAALSAKEAESGRLRSEAAGAEARAAEAAEAKTKAEDKLREVHFTGHKL